MMYGMMEMTGNLTLLRWEWSGPLLEATERPKEMRTRVQSKLPMYWWV
jgi:hypothetical protein